MPPKHSARPLGPAQMVLSAAAAVLVMVVVWIAVRAVGPAEAAHTPALALSTPSSAPPTPAPSATPTPPASASVSPAPRRTAATSKAPATRKTHTPAATKRTTRPAGNDLSATLSVPASWEQGYVAAVRIRNNGRTAASWTVTVSNNGLTDVRLTGTWNARGTQSGSRLTFTGNALAPGESTTFGFQVSNGGQGRARPSGCSVVGGACAVG